MLTGAVRIGAVDVSVEDSQEMGEVEAAGEWEERKQPA
jgi:hypothetical protein